MQRLLFVVVMILAQSEALPDCALQTFGGLLGTNDGQCPQAAMVAIQSNCAPANPAIYDCFTVDGDDTECTCNQLFDALVHGWYYTVQAICDNTIWQGDASIGEPDVRLCPQCITYTCAPTCDAVKAEIQNDNNFEHCPPVL